jgi:mannose-6-phosphate isomerase-like protein (cupin superfamily)
MQRSFTVSQLLGQPTQSGHAYQEFLRVTSLSVGIYVLKAGVVDPQRPHSEDEVYYVLNGHAQMRLVASGKEENLQVIPGTVIFVKAGEEHRFHSITEDLAVLVIFAPAETQG